MTTAESVGSGTEERLQARDQCTTRKPAFFLVPALAAVTARGIPGGVEAAQALRNHARREERVAQGFAEPARSIVLLHADDAALCVDARCKLGRDGFEWQRPDTPDLELVEELRRIHLIEPLEDGAHADEHHAASGFELAP